jgi:hypothetical protein
LWAAAHYKGEEMAVESGAHVQVWIATPEPGEWNGLTIYTEFGIEAGLIKQARPKWNIRGHKGVGDTVVVQLNPETTP